MPWGSARLAAALAAYVVELDGAAPPKLVYAADRERLRDARSGLDRAEGHTTTVMLEGFGAVEHEYLDVIAASGQALLALVDDVLDFSKIEGGRLEIDVQPFSPAEVVEGASAVFAASAAKRGVELVVRLAADLPARLNVDGARVRQIVLNLVGNAVKFTERGEVVVDAVVRDGRLSASVRRRHRRRHRELPALRARPRSA